MKPRILFIDDELEPLDKIKAALASESGVWQLEFSNHPEQALEEVLANPPAIVVADLRMPQMEGSHLLARVESEQPGVQRFLMADPKDEAFLENALNGTAHALPKPCPSETLKAAFRRALAVESWLGSEKARRIVSKVGSFPTLPAVYLKVIAALNSRDASAETISEAIAGDLAISARLLQVVNSSYFSPGEKISSIVEAVTVLGTETAKNLALAVQVFGSEGKSAEQRALIDQVWRHSMAVAAAGRRIMASERADANAVEEAYTAGLFHDIGKLILFESVPEEHAQARKLAREKQMPLYRAETEIIGCNHAEVGAYLLGRWGMSVQVIEAAAFHHEPGEAIGGGGGGLSLLATTHAANALVWERHAGDLAQAESERDEAYLEESGYADSWPRWRLVAAGREVAKPKPGAAVAPKAPPPSPEPPDLPAAADGEEATSTPPAPVSAACEAQEAAAGGADDAIPNPFRRAAASASAADRRFKVAVTLGCVAAAVAFALWLGGKADGLPGEELEEEELAATALVAEAPSSDPSPFAEGAEAASDALPEAGGLEEEGPSDAAAPTGAAEALPDGALDAAPGAEPASEAEGGPGPEAPAPTFPDIRLSGIFYNSANPAANLNGEIRRVGDVVAGARVVAIERDAVTLRHGAETRMLSLD